MIGQTLGHYRIDAFLGAGGMGVVYRAHDLKLRRDVALKFLPEAVAEKAVERERLLHEARAASILNHPNIAVVYDAGDVEGRPYVAMELVHGQTLSKQIPPHGLPIDTMLRYGTQIAGALAHAHERGVVHRDLKSANVVLGADGEAKVLDFGLARRAELEMEQVTKSRDILGLDGMAGTLPYMAPEVLRGEPADTRSDIWALGIVLYEMVAGGLPFRGTTGFELTSLILREPPASLPRHVPTGLRAVLQRCLAKDKAQRYSTAAEVRAALEALGRDAEAAPSPSRMRGERRERWLQRVMWPILGISAALVIWSIPSAIDPAKRTLTPAASATKADAVSPRVSTGGPASHNAEANEHFERAMVLLRRRWETMQARQTLAAALNLDPKFAEARAFLGFVDLLRLDSGESNDAGLLYQAEEELRRALQDDPNLVRGHAALGAVYLYLHRPDLSKAELDKALAIAPDELTSMQWLGHYHLMSGEYAAAKAAFQKNLKRDPLFLPSRTLLAGVLRMEGEIGPSIREVEKVLDQDPQNVSALRALARTYVDIGDAAKAEATVLRTGKAADENYAMRLLRALIYAQQGKRSDALRMMDAGVRQYAEVHVVMTVGSTVEAAEVYGLLNDQTSALEWLERAVRSGDERADWFRRSPLLANIRNHPRFRKVLDSIEFRRSQPASVP
jgi:serine/threonine protein kinase/Tfp pilus assembly protein PilF